MKFTYTKNTESEFLYIESNSNKKKFWQLGGEGVGCGLDK